MAADVCGRKFEDSFPLNNVTKRNYSGFVTSVFMGILLFISPFQLLAVSSSRQQNPVCGPSQCDEATAQAECDDEASIANDDPEFNLPYPVRRFRCHNEIATGNPWIRIVRDEDGGDANLNEYQNAFVFAIQGNIPLAATNLGKPTCPKQCFGDPINAATGNKYQTQVEFAGEGAFPLHLSWTYNSAHSPPYYSTYQLIFGRNRVHNYLRAVTYFPNTSVPTVFLSRPDGKAIRFTLSGSDWASDIPGAGDLYSLGGSGSITGWKFEDARGGSEVFDATGRLLVLEDSSGLKQFLSYDSFGLPRLVSDSFGRSIGFVYNSEKLVSEMQLPDGGAIRFYYTPQRFLERVEYQDGSSIEYRYNEAGYVEAWTPEGALTGVIDESQQRFSSTIYTKSLYDNNVKAVSTFLGPGVDMYVATYEPEYGAYASQASVEAPNGSTRQFSFNVVSGVAMPVTITTACNGCTSQNVSYTYDSNGQANVVTVGGLVTDYDHNSRGLLIQTIDAANDAIGNKRVTQADWHPSLRVPTERRTYDAGNVIVAKTGWTYNSRGQALTVTQTDPVTSTARTSATTYCEQADVTGGACPLIGLVIAANGPRTDVADSTSYTYYPSDDASCASTPTTCPHRKGDLWKVTNAIGQVTETLAYGGAGRVLSVKDANGVITDMQYHPRGWLTARKVRGTNNASETDDQITTIDYWPTGLVKQVTQADGAYTAYTYDAAHRLTDITDNAGNTIHYALDNAGNRIQEDTKDTGGVLKRSLSRVYNQLGQLATQADADANPTDFSYDANGNTDTVTDALGRATDNDYDPLNRLARTLQDVGGIQAETTFTYDARDNLTQVTDPKGLNTDYTYNGLGDLTQLASPDTGTITYTYDSAGNRKTQTDARGKVSTYGYDALNRLTGITYPTTSLNVVYTYDTNQGVCATGETFSQGRLTKLKDASGTTQYCFDRFGNLVRKLQTTNGKAFTVRYSHTKAGQLSSMTYPDGAIVDYVRDAQGRVTEVGTTPAGSVRQVLLNQVAYYPFGPSAGWTYGNGRNLQRTFNLNYQPETVLDGNTGGLSLGYAFDAIGNLTQLNDGFQSTIQARYAYDALNRLSDTKDGPTGTVIEHYGYDATGNRTSLTNAGGTAAYTYPATSHRLTKAGAVARIYDAAGNTTKIGGTARQFVYDDMGRMKQVKAGSTVTMNYKYNGRGEQVRKYLGTANTYTVYDEVGHWLGDYDSTGAAIQQGVWMDDQPVGLLVGASTNQALHYIEPDHLGSPRVVIDPTRDVAVWKWDAKGEAFGNTPPDQNPDGDANGFVLDIRYPGQRYDAASELNYNYFRDYEPGTGRYSQSDPIGLGDGPSTYAYVKSRPLATYDPFGMTGIFGFPPDKKAAMEAAIQSALQTLKNCKCGCSSPGSEYCFDDFDRQRVIALLSTLDFYYKPQPPNDPYVGGQRMEPDVWIYPAAFSPQACPLPSTLAHEANHFNTSGHWREEGSYYLEDICFKCKHYGK